MDLRPVLPSTTFCVPKQTGACRNMHVRTLSLGGKLSYVTRGSQWSGLRAYAGIWLRLVTCIRRMVNVVTIVLYAWDFASCGLVRHLMWVRLLLSNLNLRIVLVRSWIRLALG